MFSECWGVWKQINKECEAKKKIIILLQMSRLKKSYSENFKGISRWQEKNW